MELGATLLALGALFLLLPVFVRNPALATASESLRGFGGWMLAGGAALLGWAFAQRAARDRGTPFEGESSSGASASGGERSAKSRPSRAQPAVSVPAEERDKAPVAPPARPQAWSRAVFDVIEWRRFEAVVERLYQQAGFETRSQSHGADDGVDIWLYSRHQPGEPVGLVQCKHWQGKRVGVDKVRELRGVMASRNVKRGQFATTSVFTPDAVSFARANGINPLDVDGLLMLIAQRTPNQQADLLAVALEGDYWKPTCVNCGVKMTDRTSRSDGSAFWGCVNYPRCKTTLPMRGRNSRDVGDGTRALPLLQPARRPRRARERARTGDP
ncbi:MAG: restriction endonuclease [Comamonadaceae bacterium]|nr:restriction endonuclease [Comamonadaceae bacterium]